jgi:AraC family transcriptional regulator, arabinose operon regulatory protein
MDPRVRELIELIDGGFGQALSMDQLAPWLGLSASRLSHMFKTETGTSPGHYLKIVRIHKAQELLENTRLSVKEIMVRVGVNDQSHFVRDFKKVCGCPPVRYRMRYLAERFVNREEVRVELAAESANK